MQCDRNTVFAARPAPWRGTIRKVPAIEARRWPVYQRRAIKTVVRRDWTNNEIDRMVDMLDAGYDLREIAQRMHRTPSAVKIKSTRLGFSMRTRPMVLTAQEVGRILGVACSKRVTDWIKRGWLPGRARRSRQGCERFIWGIRYDDLIAFLRDHRYWMTNDPGRITDRDLRLELTELRAGQPHWLTPGEVARRYCVDVNTVNQWITKGFLPATRYGNHWIWSAHLDGWVMPSMRSRVGIPHGSGRRVVGLTTLEARTRIDEATV